MPTVFTKQGICSKGCAEGVYFYESCRNLCVHHKKEAVLERQRRRRAVAAAAPPGDDEQGLAEEGLAEDGNQAVDKAESEEEGCAVGLLEEQNTGAKRAREEESVGEADRAEKIRRIILEKEAKTGIVLEKARRACIARDDAETELKLAKQEIQRMQSKKDVFEMKILGVENAAQHEKDARESLELKLKERSTSSLEKKMETVERSMVTAEDNAQAMKSKVHAMEVEQKKLQDANTLLLGILNGRLAQALSADESTSCK